MPDEKATIAADRFDHARQEFLSHVRVWLAASFVPPEQRADEIRSTISAMQQALRMMEW
jgi:hypothetical protein